MKVLNQLKNPKPQYITLVVILTLIIVAGCNIDFKDLLPDEVYKPKPIQGKIELPSDLNLDISSCEIQTVYGTKQLTSASFNVDVESANVQQTIYFTNADDQVLMLGFMNSNDEGIVINVESSAVALIMQLLNAVGSSKKDWDKMVTLIKNDPNFDNLVAEVEMSVENQFDLFDENNASLINACGKLIDHLVEVDNVVMKSALIDKDISPLVFSSSGTRVSITNNGKSPAYRIKVTKDGEKVDQKLLTAASPLNISIAKLITLQGGIGVAPDPVKFNLNKAGEYEFVASSGDTEDYFKSPSFENTLLIVHNILSTTGMPLSAECTKLYADFMYTVMVKVVGDVRTTNLTTTEAIRIVIDYMHTNINTAADILIKCSTENASAEDEFGKYFAKVMRFAKWGLKAADVIGKIESGGNAAALLAFWAYQPSVITFCKMNENNELMTCGAGKFNKVYCSLSGTEDFLTWTDSYGYHWTGKSFYIGSESFEIDNVSITSTSFKISGSSYNKTYEATGTISNRVIKSISISEEYNLSTNGVLESSSSKFIKIDNLDVVLDDIAEGSYTEFEYTLPSGMVSHLTDETYYRDFSSQGMKLSQGIYTFDSSVFGSSGKITIGFSGANQ